MNTENVSETFRSQLQELEATLDDVEKMCAENTGLYTSLIKDLASDIQIVCSDIILPGHKYILSSKCEVLSKILSSGVNQLDWNAYERKTGIALLRWFYTDTIVTVDDKVTMGLLRAAHNFGLSGLFRICERKLLLSMNQNGSPEFYGIAKEVNGTMLLEKFEKFNRAPVDTLNSYIPAEVHPLTSINIHCECLDILPRNELTALLKRKDDLNEKCNKLKRSLIGIKEYVNFFDTTIWGWPAHTSVLSGRCKKFRTEFSGWSGLVKHNELAFIRWLYTDEIFLDNVDDALVLLQISHKFELHSLFNICEQALIDTFCLTSCAHVHIVATNLHATKLLEYVERAVNSYWDGIKSELFDDVVDTNHPKGAMVTTLKLPVEQPEAGTLLTLNDDCLLHLFRFVSTVDLGSIKGTCKRLQHLADQSFKLYRDKSLVIRRYSMMADIWNLKHFGKFLESLTLDGVYQTYCSWEQILPIIARFSNDQLTAISLSFNYNENVTEENLACLENILKNVKYIDLNDCDGEIVEKLLSYCRNLSAIHIDCDEVELNTLWCSKNKNVKSVTLRDLQNDDVLEELCEELVESLESLTLNIADRNDKLNHLAKLNNLKDLKIEFWDTERLNDVVTPLLQNLAVRNLLEYLCIQCPQMIETTALAICNFSRLIELEFEFTDFNANVLNIFSDKLNVKKLTFRDSEQITFEEITKVVMNKLKLEVLTVSGCDNIEVIERKSYLRLRKKRKLRILLDKDVFEKTVKLLENDLSDYVKIAAVDD